MDQVHPWVECNSQHPSTKLVDQFSTKLASSGMKWVLMWY
jgi:hypothetical protein